MEYLTEYIVERAIRAQEDDTFDTHDICFTLMTDFAADYVRELYACLEGDQYPFVNFRHSNKTRLECKEPLRGAILIDFSASLEMTNQVLLEPLSLNNRIPSKK